MLSNVCPANRGECLDGMGPVHREKYQIDGERAATGCTLPEEQLPSTQQCDHHARKLELGVPCEQAGGSQARNVVSHYKQLSGRNNIRTHSRSYTHQRQHTPLLSTFTRIEAYKHSFFPSTIKSWNKCTQQLVSKQSLNSFRRLLQAMPT